MKYFNRWVYAGVGVFVMIFAGLVYAWTVLQAPISMTFPTWTKGQLSLTFTITMFCFCIGGFIGGRLQKRYKPRILMWISAVLFLAGFALTSAAPSLIMLYLGFGVLSGLASGIAYNAVMGSVSAWFPDKQGLISGLLLMGFGISSFLIGKIYIAVTPSDGGEEWRSTFMLLGMILFFLMSIARFFTVKPDTNWRAPAATNGKAVKESYEEIGPKKMLGRRSFWLYFIWSIFLSAAGLAVISQGTPLALEASPELSMGSVATIVGLISIFNGVGRITFGALFDKAGRFVTLLTGGIVFVSAMTLLVFALNSHSLIALVMAYILTGLAYGCVPPTNSAFVNQYYGRKNYPENLSIMNLSLLVASFGSTASGAIFDATQSYITIITAVIILISLGTVVACFIKEPSIKAKETFETCNN